MYPFGLPLPSHVGEHQILQGDLSDAPSRIKDRFVSTHEQSALAFGVTLLDDLLVGRQGGKVAPGPDEAVMRRQQRFDLSGHPHARGDEHD